MRLVLSLFTFLLMVCSCKSKSSDTKEKKERESLKKISWIEGNWKGMVGPTPFYEIYRITNDSTLEIISYGWDGTDSSGSSVSKVYYHNGNYYLGDSLNWKVTSITDSSIFMEPAYKASNTILWKKRDQNSWDAVLESEKFGNREYLMERVKTFDDNKK